MRRAVRLAAATALAGAVALGPLSATAAADIPTTKVLTCSASGFTGSMKLTRTSKGSYLYYKITKGSNKGGNHANIYFSDGGNNPILNLSNDDNGIQDGNYHLYYGPFGRGSGGIGVTFVFDRSNDSDPRCNKTGYF